jgi:DNA-binding response OmpR family regulator
MDNDDKERAKNLWSALVIDDEVDLCMMIKSFFRRKNKQVDFSTSLKEGLRKFDENQPDVLILDHNLPDGLGIGYIKTFKEKLKLKNKPLYIIVMSAMSNLRAKAMENGADCFIDKPLTLHKLNEILQFKN